MATYVKGNPVENATSYELFEKINGAYKSLKTGSEINFDVSALGLAAGEHTLVVKAKADGYEDSDYSNEVVYKEAGVPEEADWIELFTTEGITLANLPQSTGGTKTFTPLNKTVPASTPIGVIDLIQRETATASEVKMVQVFITNANTKTVIDHPIVDATIPVITDKNGTKVARVVLDKTYDVPVHIGVKGDRGGTGDLTGVNYGTLTGETNAHSFEALEIGTVISANSNFIPLMTVYSY